MIKQSKADKKFERNMAILQNFMIFVMCYFLFMEENTQAIISSIIYIATIAFSIRKDLNLILIKTEELNLRLNYLHRDFYRNDVVNYKLENSQKEFEERIKAE
jgi:hypothetical protein